MEIHDFKITKEDSGKRLDVFIAERLPFISRSRIQKLIAGNTVSVDGEFKKSHFKLRGNEGIHVEIPEPEKAVLEPENIPLQILYEDSDIVVVNKPAGLVVHPGAGNPSGTLANALLYHCGVLAQSGSPLRPGIVHRLDKDTSGVMVAAKTDSAYLNLVGQFKNRKVEKVYFALVKGIVPLESGKIDVPVGRHTRDRKKMSVATYSGKPAFTTYQVKRKFENATLLELKLKTGRTHQIRVHLSYLGYPLLGDAKYGNREKYKRHALHAGSLSFRHPSTGEVMTFTAPLPDDLAILIDKLQ
ncbi:MAG: RluA family pseudouridine synthase [Candidatus Omnitrophica bacterium]|nr:RluA family pseudouridine synthase [Candidatus Omnitrophota bacterium]